MDVSDYILPPDHKIGFEQRKYDATFRCRCWSRRCAHSNCNHKSIWRDYTVVTRSCLVLPPTHLVTLRWPLSDNGGRSTQRINRFVELLDIGECGFAWWYDDTTEFLWHHVHMLLRASHPAAMLLTACPGMVNEAWLRAWEDWEQIWHDEATSGHVRPIGDLIHDIAYATKHGWYHRQVTRELWAGRMSGGNRSFYIDTKKNLFRDMKYRDYGDKELIAAESHMRLFIPGLVSDKVETPPARQCSYRQRKRLITKAIRSLLVISLSHPIRFVRKCIKIKHQRRPRKHKPYFVWPNAP